MKQITCSSMYHCCCTAEEMEMAVSNWRSEIRWDVLSSEARTVQPVTGISVPASVSLNAH